MRGQRGTRGANKQPARGSSNSVRPRAAPNSPSPSSGSGVLPLKLSKLESLLQSMAVFKEPKVHLEQYPTSAHLAARMLYMAAEYGDIVDKHVLDLGSGCGMLSVAATLLCAKRVLGVEIDKSAIAIAHSNAAALELPATHAASLSDDAACLCFAHADVLTLSWTPDTHTLHGCAPAASPLAHSRNSAPASTAEHSSSSDDDDDDEEADDGSDEADRDSADAEAAPDLGEAARSGGEQVAVAMGHTIDTVIMNPPFGTKQKGVDMRFLEKAFQVEPRSIYSLHKSSTRRHIEKVAAALGASSATVIAQLRYDLPRTMAFHKKQSVDIEVDLWRFTLPAQSRI